MLVDLTTDPLMQLLVDATRRAETAGASLAHAHRNVGRALAHAVARHLPLDSVAIEHVAGPSTGVRIKPGSEPTVIALMRAGLFVAEGLWESLPGSSLVLQHGEPGDRLPGFTGRITVVVDAVVNTGTSMVRMLEAVRAAEAAKIISVALVAYRPTIEKLAEQLADVEFIAARLSERSYVGRGGTDTGFRLFGT